MGQMLQLFGVAVVAWSIVGGSGYAARAAEESSPPAPAIRLNTLGFRPGRPMAATVAAGAAGGFQVRRLSDGAVVWEGETAEPRRNADTDEQLAVADFSAIGAPTVGEYELILAESGERVRFRIADDLYRDPFRTATRAMYLWRCGVPVHGEHQGAHFEHGPCHQEDAWLDFIGGGHERKECIGGWHDAGDYNKYVVNAGRPSA